MSEQFDVFLCHNSQDKPEVKKIANRLKQKGLRPWLDVWELPPGRSWQELLEEQIEDVKSAAVFVGSSGFGPWQQREIRAFLSEFVDRGCPVIPVLLEDAPKKPKLPIFLKALTWVDFRDGESNPMGKLIWGITGIKPSGFDVSISSSMNRVEKVTNLFQNFTEDLGNDINLDMIAIPGGIFMMGTEDEEIERLLKEPNKKWFNNEKPQHQVTVQPFFMGKYPITQAQWKAIASLPKIERDLKPYPSHFKGDERPVEEVSWDDAVEFCQRISKQTGKEYRLPSEAEWEYACRAGTTTPYHFGENITDKLANYGKKMGQTTSVGKFRPNAFGLYDMHGNVWEWCQDDWHDNYEGAPTDGGAWSLSSGNIKVVRGGSWVNPPFLCRSAYRYDFSHDFRLDNFGFRVIRIVSSTT